MTIIHNHRKQPSLKLLKTVDSVRFQKQIHKKLHSVERLRKYKRTQSQAFHPKCLGSYRGDHRLALKRESQLIP